MSEELTLFMESHRRPLEDALADCLPTSSRPSAGRLNDALRYAVFSGGKRLRPMLTLLGGSVAGVPTEDSMIAACAVEYLHTSSLIFDDLPAMDDADLRRGHAALHLTFGEGVALLAALALLNQSYALLALAARNGRGETTAERLVFEATRCVGADGMIGGQAADLEIRGATGASDNLACRELKTTGLLRLTMTASAIAGGAEEAEISALARFGECLGAAYQIGDDLLDELSESEVTGKPARQDARHLRPTFVAELGVEGAHRLALSLAEEGKRAVTERFAGRAGLRLLTDAADLIIGRIGRHGSLTGVAV